LVQHILLSEENVGVSPTHYYPPGTVHNLPPTAKLYCTAMEFDPNAVFNYPKDLNGEALAATRTDFVEGRRLIVPRNCNNVAIDYGYATRVVDPSFDGMVQHDVQNKFKDGVQVASIADQVVKQPLVSPLCKRVVVVYTKNEQVKLTNVPPDVWVVAVPRISCKRMLSGLGGIVLTSVVVALSLVEKAFLIGAPPRLAGMHPR
jgi:hypothetical protein